MDFDFSVLDINDQSITLVDNTGAKFSPGYALFQDKWLTLGEEAEQKIRLFPRASNHQFWHKLSLEPLNNATNLVSHSADLVYHHLKQLSQELQHRDLVVVTPGYFNDEQIRLLMGICSSLELNVRGVIDTALIACSHLEPGVYWHLDTHLHQSVLSQVSIESGKIFKQQTIIIPSCGAATVRDACVRAISEQFIQQTRFNPRHKGEHEQILYNQLNTWISSLKEGETRIQVADHSIVLGLNNLQKITNSAVQPIYQALDEHIGGGLNCLILSPSSAEITQLDPKLAQASILPDRHNTAQIQKYRSQLISDNIDEALFPESLDLYPTTDTKTDSSATINTPTNGPSTPQFLATHLLAGATAYPLNPGWLSEHAPESFSLTPTETSLCQIKITDKSIVITPNKGNCRVNRANITTATELNLGDTISNDNVTYQLIRVQSDGS